MSEDDDFYFEGHEDTDCECGCVCQCGCDVDYCECEPETCGSGCCECKEMV